MVASTLAAPAAVKASDVHLAYELLITNAVVLAAQPAVDLRQLAGERLGGDRESTWRRQ